MRRLAPLLLCLLAPAAAAAAATPAQDAPSSARLTLTGAPRSGTGYAVASLRGGALAIGSPFEDGDRGVVHVVLDTSGTGTVSLDDPGLRQYEIIGGPLFRAGTAVADAGDVNGDGRDDLVLTAPRANGYKVPGRAYVVYGKDDTAPIDLAALTPRQGFLIDRVVPGSPNGTPLDVAGAGDVDGDGRGDVILARADGDAELVYASGRRLRIVTGGHGGPPAVAGAGDVNHDGRADIVLGVPQYRLPGHRFPVNSAFVVFGARRDGTMHLAQLGTRGFRISGLVGQRIYRPAVAAAGDVNRDDRDDVVLVADPGGVTGERPRAAIVFGSRTNATVDASHTSHRATRILGDTAHGRVSLLGPVAAIGRGVTTYSSVTGSAGGPYEGSAFVLDWSRAHQGVELDRVQGRRALRWTFPAPGSACGAMAGAGAYAPLGLDAAVGAPALNDCGGEVLVLPAPF